MDASDEERLFGADSSDSSSSDSESPSKTTTTHKPSSDKSLPKPTAQSSSAAPTPAPTSAVVNPPKPSATQDTTESKPAPKTSTADEDEETRRLFGGDDDSSSSSSSSSDSEDEGEKREGKKLKVKRKGEEKGEREEEKKGEVEVEAEEEIVVEPTQVEIPSLPRLKDTSELRFSRLPNLLHLVPTAFDADTYSEDREMKKLRKLGKELVGDNIIRWRFKRDAIKRKVLDEETGKPVLESNARFVEWSDGSVQLLLGGETFEVLSQPSHGQFLYAMSVDKKNDKTFLEAHGRIKADLRFRPTSLASSAHKDLELRVKGRNLKSTKLLQTAVLVDPEKEQEERAKAKEDALRLKERQRAKNEYEYGKRSKSKQWNERFLEEGSSQQEYEDEEEYGTSVKAIKEKYKGKSRAQRAFSSSDSSDEDYEDDRNVATKRKPPAERSKPATVSSPAPAPEGKSDAKDSSDAKAEEKAPTVASEKAPVSKAPPADDMDDKDEDIVHVAKKRRTNLIDSDSE